ncbi:MAG TPA: hypothetical protein VH082_11385, partial [Rudaea sp.]|nr:hypothetical protein [Rudaea sp.]
MERRAGESRGGLIKDSTSSFTFFDAGIKTRRFFLRPKECVFSVEGGLDYFALDLLSSNSFRRKRRVTFCSTAKSHQKTFFDLSRSLLSADSTSVLLAADRAHPCA